MSDDAAQYVCFACIGDAYLKAEIERAGEGRRYTICNGTRASIEFEDLLAGRATRPRWVALEAPDG